MENRKPLHPTLQAMIDEYFRRHPDAGLAWWDLPLEQQPEGFKIEMYDIIWDLMHKEEANG